MAAVVSSPIARSMLRRTAPIEYEGRRYLFSHTAPVSGYHPDAQEELYVFREPGAIA
jgi:hypothetical protein